MKPLTVKHQPLEYGLTCSDETCQQCCEHDFDWEEGYTCLNCGEQGDIGALIDAAMDQYEDR